MTTVSERRAAIARVAALPAQVSVLVDGLSAEELTTAYDEGEWTIAQNVHHLCDSHMNSYVRCKLMATEEEPPLKPYDQDRWAALQDARAADLTASLALLSGLHARWVHFWETLPEDGWARTGLHASGKVVTLDDQLQLYAQHGEDHLDQMQRVLIAGGLAG
jgi:hypothetical protein